MGSKPLQLNTLQATHTNRSANDFLESRECFRNFYEKGYCSGSTAVMIRCSLTRSLHEGITTASPPSEGFITFLGFYNLHKVSRELTMCLCREAYEFDNSRNK